MTNSTSSASSSSSFLWDQLSSWGQSFNEAQKDIYEFEQMQRNESFANILNFGETVGEKLGFKGAGKAAACSLYPDRCIAEYAPKIPPYLAYHVPKMALETTVSITKWTGRSICHLGSTVAGWVKPDFVNITTPQVLNDLYDAAADKATYLSDEATAWVTGQPVIREIIEMAPLEEVFNPNQTPLEGNFTSGLGGNSTTWIKTVKPVTGFQATEMIGASLLIALCSYKCTKNLRDVVGNVWRLLTNEREDSASTAVNSRNPVTLNRTKKYTTVSLLKDIAMQSLFAGLWAAGAYCAHEGIYSEVLDAAAGNSEHARMVAITVTALSALAPTAIKWGKEALYAPASTDNVGTGAAGSSSMAGAAGSSLHIPSLRDIENMSYEEAMRILEERNASEYEV